MKSKTFYTTTEAAKLAEVTPKTVIGWAEKRYFKFHRVAMGGRKIRKKDFHTFLLAMGFPEEAIPKEEQEL